MDTDKAKQTFYFYLCGGYGSFHCFLTTTMFYYLFYVKFAPIYKYNRDRMLTITNEMLSPKTNKESWNCKWRCLPIICGIQNVERFASFESHLTLRIFMAQYDSLLWIRSRCNGVNHATMLIPVLVW